MKKYLAILTIGLIGGTLQGCISAKSQPTGAASQAAPAPTAVVAVVEPAPEPLPIGDSDGDGVNDDLDACPGTRAGVQVDARGCEILFSFSGPLFDFDKATLTPSAQAKLTAAAKILNQNPGKSVEVIGHTDSKGSDVYNLGLGMRRAEAVRAYLDSKNIPLKNMKVFSYGESQPVATNDNRAGRSLNRRVEIVEMPGS